MSSSTAIVPVAQATYHNVNAITFASFLAGPQVTIEARPDAIRRCITVPSNLLRAQSDFLDSHLRLPDDTVIREHQRWPNTVARVIMFMFLGKLDLTAAPDRSGAIKGMIPVRPLSSNASRIIDYVGYAIQIRLKGDELDTVASDLLVLEWKDPEKRRTLTTDLVNCIFTPQIAGGDCNYNKTKNVIGKAAAVHYAQYQRSLQHRGRASFVFSEPMVNNVRFASLVRQYALDMINKMGTYGLVETTSDLPNSNDTIVLFKA